MLIRICIHIYVLVCIKSIWEGDLGLSIINLQGRNIVYFAAKVGECANNGGIKALYLLSHLSKGINWLSLFSQHLEARIFTPLLQHYHKLVDSAKVA